MKARFAFVAAVLVSCLGQSALAGGAGEGIPTDSPPEGEWIPDVEEGIKAGDTAVLKRGRAAVDARFYESRANRRQRVPAESTPSCNALVNNMCITESGSLIVLPGANVFGDIININGGMR